MCCGWWSCELQGRESWRGASLLGRSQLAALRRYATRVVAAPGSDGGHRCQHPTLAEAPGTVNPDSGARADIFLLPLAVADPNEIRALGLDPGVLSRRVPDFLHQIVNQGDAVPTGMVEIQSPASEQPVAWIELRELPDADAAFDLLPEGYVARAVVLGRISVEGDALAVELRVHFAEDLDSCCSMTVAGSFSPHDPANSLTKLAERLARVLDVALPPLQHNLLTRNGAAFFAFLRGLDGAALLSGDLDVASFDRPEALLRPLADAVRLDPSFGLALRTWHATVALATANGRLDKEAWARLADACLGARPQDGEACVAIAEQLSVLGDQERATRWLQHAVDLSPPPPRGLESLGIVFANRGEIRAARDLWLAGLEQDGHPDFFAHLARLAFACGDPADAWEKVASGLRRIRERSTRLEEWV